MTNTHGFDIFYAGHHYLFTPNEAAQIDDADEWQEQAKLVQMHCNLPFADACNVLHRLYDLLDNRREGDTK